MRNPETKLNHSSFILLRDLSEVSLPLHSNKENVGLCLASFLGAQKAMSGLCGYQMEENSFVEQQLCAEHQGGHFIHSHPYSQQVVR